MRIIATIIVIFLSCSFSISQETALKAEIDRNPFRKSTTTDSSATPVKSVSAPIQMPDVAVQEESFIIKQAVPPILSDLRSIAIAKDGKRLALFGRRIVSLNEEIEGFRVIAISLDKVVLQQDNEELVVKIGETSKNRERTILNNPIQDMSNTAEQNWSSIFGALSPDGGMNMDDDSMNMFNRVNQIRNIIQPFLDKKMQNNAPSERQR